MASGKINVTADNIFPIIKKFLYSDHEIFLRELISNAVDASTKLKHLTSLGEAKGELGDLTLQIKVDKEAGTLHVIDRGIGMTEEEVEKYINQLAFSGAEEFLKKYDDKVDNAGIIGHFGLGFYSAFMVAKKVEIISQSHTQLGTGEGVHWTCEGSPEFTLEKTEKADRGTEIILHIADDSTEFLEEGRIAELLAKYAKFMPIPIQFGTTEQKEGEGDDAVTTEVPNIINNTEPAWTKSPGSLSDEDYTAFYRELYPATFDEPLFNIHLNVDYPFNLTGVLFFPKLKPNMEIQKNKIQLYQNQVFVTDNVEGIVPEFLTMLHGVVDSPDIPLNVSRSYLQADGNVKKISGHITKKVADKLDEMFRNNREDFESKWDDIKVIIEYGMLSEAKFYDKAEKFALYKNAKGEYYTFQEYLDKVKEAQTNSNGDTVILYASHAEAQHSFIAKAENKGYDVLILDSPIVSHLIQKLETEKTNLRFSRVDSDTIDNLIKKEENTLSKLSEDQEKALTESIEKNVDTAKFTVKIEKLDSEEEPFSITVPEFIRRMKEMSMSGGGMMGMDNFPEQYNLVVNANHPLATKIIETSEGDRAQVINQAIDLAMLQQNLLHGEALTAFVKRSYDLIK